MRVVFEQIAHLKLENNYQMRIFEDCVYIDTDATNKARRFRAEQILKNEKFPIETSVGGGIKPVILKEKSLAKKMSMITYPTFRNFGLSGFQCMRQASSVFWKTISKQAAGDSFFMEDIWLDLFESVNFEQS